MSNELTTEQLKLYLKGWRKIRAKAYRDLVASYTPEQQQKVKLVNHAASQAALCVTRLDARPRRVHRDLSWPADPAKA